LTLRRWADRIAHSGQGQVVDATAIAAFVNDRPATGRRLHDEN
jgi:hypothetical protein